MSLNGPQYMTHSYLEYYVSHIKPVINKLDIAIKTRQRLKNKDLAEILGLEETEIEEIRQKHNIKHINRTTILEIIENGSSAICEMFRRELETGSPFTYTAEQIAFIYGLDEETVINVCKELNISEITWQSMPDVFRTIPYEK
ncbi:hypothetical protein LJB89_03530 [Tyzzerella sp. OttesenSCG-928-J15]|nr:hypothetical protein [Tyzzerella sp. OttesenSCG-928-J15]